MSKVLHFEQIHIYFSFQIFKRKPAGTLAKIHIDPSGGYEPFECSIGFQEPGGVPPTGTEKALVIAVAVTYVCK